MDSFSQMIFGFVGFVIVIGLVILLHYLFRNVFNPTGKGSAEKTRGILRRFAGIRRFQVLGDLDLEMKGKTAHIENILIGYFGVLMVHTLGARGEYYGTLDGRNWYVMLDEKRTTIQNPLPEQERAEALLRSIFSVNKLYNIPVEHVIYISNKSKKTGLFITHSGEILLPGKLPEYLNKTKFEKDIGLDVGAVKNAIEGSKIK
jgi:hypothetical protein